MAMIGMDRNGGRPASGIAHLTQSIADILSTPKGSRRMRPDYGSLLPRMVDKPATPGWIASAQAEAAGAIERWEPRLKVKRVSVVSVIDGRVTMKVAGDYLGDGVVLEITV